jgi:hypothetical protein
MDFESFSKDDLTCILKKHPFWVNNNPPKYWSKTKLIDKIKELKIDINEVNFIPKKELLRKCKNLKDFDKKKYNTTDKMQEFLNNKKETTNEIKNKLLHCLLNNSENFYMTEDEAQKDIKNYF